MIKLLNSNADHLHRRGHRKAVAACPSELPRARAAPTSISITVISNTRVIRHREIVGNVDRAGRRVGISSSAEVAIS
jgi:hypothetical protein